MQIAGFPLFRRRARVAEKPQIKEIAEVAEAQEPQVAQVPEAWGTWQALTSDGAQSAGDPRAV